MCRFSAYVAFNEATNGETDMKHDNDENLAQSQWIVWTGFLLQGDRVWNTIQSLEFRGGKREPRHFLWGIALHKECFIIIIINTRGVISQGFR